MEDAVHNPLTATMGENHHGNTGSSSNDTRPTTNTDTAVATTPTRPSPSQHAPLTVNHTSSSTTGTSSHNNNNSRTRSRGFATASNVSSTSFCTVPSTSTTTSVASLLQSAAKVSLYDHQQQHQHQHHQQQQQQYDSNNRSDKLFPDNEYDDFVHSLFVDATTAGNLQSLQRPVFPTLPDEQDRKRFLGCLAAVIVAQYQYETKKEEEEAERMQRHSTTTTTTTKDDTTAAIWQENPWSQTLYEDVNPNNNNNNSVYQDDEDSDDFDYLEENLDNSETSAATTSSSSKVSPQRRTTASETNSTMTKKSSTSSRLFATTTKPNRSQEATLRAQERYRKRRYELYGHFLIASTEHLQLEKGHGRCFLPILEQLLVVPHHPQSNSSSSSNSNTAPPLRRQSMDPKSISFYDVDYIQYQMDETPNLRPFLEGLSPGAGIRCIAMLLIQHLLQGNVNGYDARIRHVLKSVGVLVILHDIMIERLLDQQQMGQQQQQRGPSSKRHNQNPTHILFVDETDDEYSQYDTTGPSRSHQGVTVDNHQHNNTNAARQEIFPADLLTLATRQFESLEQYLAQKFLEISTAQQQQQQQSTTTSTGSLSSRGDMGGSARDKFFRGLKIGGTAVAAGTLFAITGGLAAPAIAAGVAAVVGTTGLAATAIALTTHAAVVSIFGVGGGTLVAYKMKRRTVGLTEFEFCKETPTTTKSKRDRQGIPPDAELFYTVCISGWLRDDCDFQRPWGLSPTNPPIDDRLELLERFYSVHRPGHVPRCAKILDNWKREEKQLWKLLRDTYKRDPDHLFPFEDGPRFRASLTLEQKEAVEKILVKLGCVIPNSTRSTKGNQGEATLLDRMRFGDKNDAKRSNSFNTSIFQDDSSHGFDDIAPPVGDEAAVGKIPHLATVWDYHATYGGELYTVRWESDLIEELCMSVIDLAADVVTGATKQLLKYTVLSALATALAIPVALKSAADMIDGTWTLVVERSDIAGQELAQSLLFSTAGNRPVTLVGFSFGARVIYSCLKELARYQEKWEDFQEKLSTNKSERNKKSTSANKDKNDDYMRTMREPASIVGDVSYLYLALLTLELSILTMFLLLYR